MRLLRLDAGQYEGSIAGSRAASANCFDARGMKIRCRKLGLERPIELAAQSPRPDKVRSASLLMVDFEPVRLVAYPPNVMTAKFCLALVAATAQGRSNMDHRTNLAVNWTEVGISYESSVDSATCNPMCVLNWLGEPASLATCSSPICRSPTGDASQLYRTMTDKCCALS